MKELGPRARSLAQWLTPKVADHAQTIPEAAIQSCNFDILIITEKHIGRAGTDELTYI